MMAEDRLTICLALHRVAVSQYNNYNFNSMCNFDGLLLGCNEDGLFKLDDGDLDDTQAIDAFFRLGATEFGMIEEKAVRFLFISGRLDGLLKASINPDGKGDVSSDVIPKREDLRLIGHRVPMGKDVKGRSLDLKIENIQGSDFTINRIDALLVKKASGS
jgi:hypothetical protein